MDPYCRIALGEQQLTTRVHKSGGKFPKWNDALVFKKGMEDTIILTVLDQDTMKKDDIVGECTYNLQNLFGNGQVTEWVNIFHKNKSAGQVKLQLELKASAEPQNQQQQFKPQPQLQRTQTTKVFMAGIAK